jgi:membrane protease YdiL (CAAX protease family)
LVGYAGAIVVGAILGFGESSPLWVLFVANLPLYAALAGTPWLVTRRRGAGSVAELGLSFRPVDIAAVPGGAALQLAVGAAYAPFVDRDRLEQPARELADRAAGVGGWVLLALMTVVIAPLVEELFYRGLVQSAVRRRLPPVPAVGVTAAVFAALHFQPLQFPGLFAFGAVAGMLVVRSGRLGPAIAAHLGFNAAALVALVIG